MKRITIFILLVCNISLFAQRKYTDEKGFLGFSVGPSIPFGDFKKADDFNNNDGFAKTGLTFNVLSFGYRFYKFFGIAATLNYGNSNLNTNELLNYYNTTETQQNKEYISIGSSPYSYGSAMVGPYLSYHAGMVDIEFRGMGGIAFAMMPEITSNYYLGGNQEQMFQDVKQKEASSINYSIDIGLGVKYSLMDNLYFIGFIDYYQTDHTFNTTQENLTTGESEEIVTKKKIQFILPSVGVAYKIRQKKKYRRWAF